MQKLKNPLVIVFCMSALIILFFKIPLVHCPTGYDDAGYIFAGREIARGKIPYVQVFDHKTPGLPYLFALIDLTGNSGIGAFRYFEIFWILVTLLFFIKVAKKIFLNSRTAGLATIIFAIFVSFFYLDDNMVDCAETFQIIPNLFVIYILLFIKSENSERRNTAYWFLSGFGVFLSFFLKPSGIVMVLPIMAYLLYFCSTKKGYLKNLMKSTLFSSAGFLIPLAVFLAYLYIKSALYSFYEGMVVFNSNYSRFLTGFTPIQSNFELISHFFNNIIAKTNDYPVTILLTVVGLFFSIIKKNIANVLLIVFFATSYLGIALGGKYFNHYFIQILPACALLVAYGVDNIYSCLKEEIIKKSIATMVCATITTAFFINYNAFHIYTSLNQLIKRSKNNAWQNKEFIRKVNAMSQFVKPGDSIVNWDDPALYLFTNTTCSTRFFFENAIWPYHWPQYNPDNEKNINLFATNKILNGMIKEFDADPPKIFTLRYSEFYKSPIIMGYIKNNYYEYKSHIFTNDFKIYVRR